MSRLADQIKQVLPAFAALATPPALIGGLALAAHRVVRATSDVDFLVAAADADRVHALLLSLGYRCVHRSEDAAYYVRGDEGMDLLYAHRPIALRLLSQAATRDTPFGRLRIISAEGLIGFKLQALCNNPSRSRDLDDIRQLLRANRQHLDMAEVRQYFALFERGDYSMSCLPRAIDAASLQPICGNVAEPARAAEPQDSIEAWLSLMEVVEALCPEWPLREEVSRGVFRL